MVTCCSQILNQYSIYLNDIAQKASAEYTEQGKVIPIFIEGLWHILGVIQYSCSTFPHHVEWLHRIVGSKVDRPFGGVRTVGGAYMINRQGRGARQNVPGVCYHCFRSGQKFQTKNRKISYILTAIISDVILNPKASNLENLLLIIRPCYLTAQCVFRLIVMAANGGNSVIKIGSLFWYTMADMM